MTIVEVAEKPIPKTPLKVRDIIAFVAGILLASAL